MKRLQSRLAPQPFTLSARQVSILAKVLTNAQRTLRRQRLIAGLLLGLFILAELSLSVNQSVSIAAWLGMTLYFLVQLTVWRGGAVALDVALGLLAATRLLNLGLSDVLVRGGAGVVGLSLLVGTLLAFRYLKELDTLYYVTALGLRFQLWVALSGVVLGYLAYLLRSATPEPVGWILAGTLFMVFVAAAGEELFFRVLLVRALVPLFSSGWIVLYTALLYGVLHLYWGGALGGLFAFQVGLYFAWVVVRSRSYIGVLVAHVLLNLTSFVVLPHVLS